MTPDPTPTTDHGAAGFCTDHGQAALDGDAIRAEAERLHPITGVVDDVERRDNLLWSAGFQSGARWALAARDAEVARLRAGREMEQNALRNALPIVARGAALRGRLEHIVDRYGDAHDAKDCAVLHDLRAALAAAPGETETDR